MKASSVPCPTCGADPNKPCFAFILSAKLLVPHEARVDLAEYVDELILGGITADHVPAEGPWALVLSLLDGGCACDEEPDAGLGSAVPELWCLRCQAHACFDLLQGREPGSTVMRERCST